MGKYDEIIDKLKQLGVEVKKITDIRPDSARIISELLDKLEHKENTTVYQENSTLYNNGGEGMDQPTQDTNIELTPTQRKIMDTLQEVDMMRFKDLAERLDMKQNQLWNELDFLLKFGLVKKQTLSRKQVYYSVA